MQIRKIYSIVIILFIASVSARAESLQELINRKKIDAIGKVKPIVQKMINDSIEVYKQHPLWNDDYNDAENFHYIYLANLDFNDKAFYFDDSTSIISIIDTTKLLGEEIYVLDKQYREIAQIYRDGIEFNIWSFIFEYPTDQFISHYSYHYDDEQIVLKQFSEQAPFVRLPMSMLSSQILINNKIFNMGIRESQYTDFDEYLRNDNNKHWYESDYIKYEGICKQIKKYSNTKYYIPKVKRDFSKSIIRIEHILDSLDQKYLVPIQANKKKYFYDAVMTNGNQLSNLTTKFPELNVFEDSFIQDSAKLSFRSEYIFDSNSILDRDTNENYLDCLTFPVVGYEQQWYQKSFAVYWENQLIGKLDETGLEIYEPCDLEDDNWQYYNYTVKINQLNYDWSIALSAGGGFIFKKQNELYRVFAYNNFISSPIPYQQFLEQVIDEYYIRKDYGK